MKANKPNGYVRFTERLVDGKLKIYLGEQGSMRGADNRFHATGTYRFFLKMPDGTYYKINNSGNLKKIIIPYLQQCDQFKSQYKGQYSSDEKPFVDMIKFYNSICK